MRGQRELVIVLQERQMACIPEDISDDAIPQRET